MTKGELRRARILARASGQPLTGELALANGACKGAVIQAPKRRLIRTAERRASRAEQHGRYIDSGPSAWDDK